MSDQSSIVTEQSDPFMYLGPKGLGRFLTTVLPAGVSVLVHGGPGVGKSDIAAQVAAAAGKAYFDFRASNHDPSDVRFPIVNQMKETVKWVQSVFPTDANWDGLINLEELTQAPPLMQAALLQLLRERRIGDYRVPEKAWLMGCANRQGDKAGTHRLISPIANRFCHIGLTVEPSEWLEWSVGGGIHGSVREYIRLNPNRLNEPDYNTVAFPSPRSWEALSKVMPAVLNDDAMFMAAASGCIGRGATSAFEAFVKNYRAIPDINEIVAKPMTTKVPDEPDTLYAVVAALTDVARTNDKAHKALMAYGSRMPEEFTTLLVRDCEAASKGKFITGTPEVVQWIREHRDNFKTA